MKRFYQYVRNRCAVADCALVHQTEHPQWNAVGVACFYVVYGQVAVGQVFYLIKCFAFTTNFEQVSIINDEIALWRVVYDGCCRKLVYEEGFPHRADICILG